MRKHICILILILLSGATAIHAQEPEGTAEITSPIEGQTLFGLVEITGSASHPSLFGGYALEWSNAQNPDVWLPIQQTINQQVTNGILGQWDTAVVPDGSYQIRLRMFLNDGSVRDFEVRGLRVANAAPTAIPSAPPAQPTATLPVIPGGDATPTSIIEQPPTITPLPTFAPPASAASAGNSDEDGDASTVFNFDAAQQAICNGVFFSVALFGIILLYLALRSQISPFTRRLMWQIRSELDSNEKDY